MGNIKGLDKLLKDLDNVQSKAFKEVDKITEANAQEIALDAKQLAPKNFGKLAQSINVKPSENLEYKVVVDAKYGAYVEFGTGSKTQIPTELSEVAAQFQGRKEGSFEEGLIAIRDWCKAKGIPEEAAYPILVNLINKGQKAQPYLYPAFVKGRKRFFNDLKDWLNDITTTR